MFGEKHGVGVGGGCIGLRPHFALHAFTASASPSISKELETLQGHCENNTIHDFNKTG